MQIDSSNQFVKCVKSDCPNNLDRPLFLQGEQAEMGEIIGPLDCIVRGFERIADACVWCCGSVEIFKCSISNTCPTNSETINKQKVGNLGEFSREECC